MVLGIDHKALGFRRAKQVFNQPSLIASLESAFDKHTHIYTFVDGSVGNLGLGIAASESLESEEKFSLWKCIPYFHEVAPLKIRFRVLVPHTHRARALAVVQERSLEAHTCSSLQAMLGRTFRMLY